MNTRRMSARAVGCVGVIVVLIIGLITGLFLSDYFKDVLERYTGISFGPSRETGGTAAPSVEKRLWTCGMHPQVLQDHPGTCPICGMELTPVSAGLATSVAGAFDHTLTIDPIIVQNMGVRTAQVTEGPLARTIRAVGYLQEPEPNRRDINLRISGWIESLHADTIGMRLHKGDRLFELYSPELQLNIQELISARKSRESLTEPEDNSARSLADSMIASAKRKLQLIGIDPDEIDRLAKLDQPPRTITFASPVDGYLAETMVAAGAAVQAGQNVMRIIDNSTMWIELRIHEQDLPAVRDGELVTTTFDSRPGESIEGRIIFFHPRLDDMTRTGMVRVQVPNPDFSLRQGMFGEAVIHTTLAENAILIPREALLDTGTRQVVFISTGNGHFSARSVKVGAAGDEGMIQILDGLIPGETVVTSGQFLLDSESRMREAIQKHMSENLVVKPAPIEDAKSLPWSPDIDTVIQRYLEIASKLGEKQETPTPILIADLALVAKQLADHAEGNLKSLAESIHAGAVSMGDQTIDQQRESFKSLSEHVIDLSRRATPSNRIAPVIYIAHCPMAPGSWLQIDETIANPYYATSMKRCGEITGRITTREVANDQQDH